MSVKGGVTKGLAGGSAAGGAHPYPPIAPVTTGALGAKGCDTHAKRVRRAEMGA